ncbi:MAG: tRNA (guanosine(46)-N7)-methyltransferase TrmB [Alphaproteobacteria bacterium]
MSVIHRLGLPLKGGDVMSNGRRRGRAMRPKRLALTEELLPKLALSVVTDDRGGLVPLELAALFDSAPRDIWLEIGFGAGEHLVAQARANPDVGLIGCDPFFEGVGKLLSQIDAEGLKNIRIFPGEARRLISALPVACLGKVFALFPDPWPKKRHHKRRLVNRDFLDALARVMCDDGEFRLSTDHDEHGRWLLGFLLRHEAFSWTARGPGGWRARPADGVLTRYEQKALAADRTCIYLQFKRRKIGNRSL